jgi:hypothetical protein
LTDARIYFKDSREPFALTVAGQKWYVLTSGEDVAAVYKVNDGSLSYDIFAEEVLRMLGASEDGVKKSFDAKPGQKTLSVVFRELSRLQLQPGKQYEKILNPSLRYISDHLKVSKLLEYDPAEQSKTPTVDLYHLISEIFIGFGQEVYFGKSLAKVEPDMISEFVTFETLAWQVLYQYPSFMCKKVLAAKEKVVSGLERYFEQPVESRSDAAWMTLELEKSIRERKIRMSDAAIVFFQLYWRYESDPRISFANTDWDAVFVGTSGKPRSGCWFTCSLPRILRSWFATRHHRPSIPTVYPTRNISLTLVLFSMAYGTRLCALHRLGLRFDFSLETLRSGASVCVKATGS